MQPFEAALGDAKNTLQSAVRVHFLQMSGHRRYVGTMARVWRRTDWLGQIAGLFLFSIARAEMLFPETGMNIPFELENTVFRSASGETFMRWTRAFHFPKVTRRFDAVMHFAEQRNVIVDWLGKDGTLEVELHPKADAGVLVMESGRQWLRFKNLKIPIPTWLTGKAVIREWQDGDRLSISVTISNTLLGNFFGYEGSFALESEQMEKP